MVIRISTKNSQSDRHPLPFGVYGLLSITFGIIGDLLAYIFYPGYNFIEKAVSSLCKGPGGLFFQIGSVISGIFAIPFVIYLNDSFNPDYIEENLKKKAIIVALISCTCLIILGVFCGSNPIIALIHGIFAFTSWIFGLLYITFFNIFMLRDPKYIKSLSLFGFCVTFLLTLFLVLFFSSFVPSLRFLVIILPSIEWINTIAIIVWYFIVSLYTLIKKVN
ncbi:MAG: DUF998 domain-containing protein [Promethearchaeota archaeon]